MDLDVDCGIIARGLFLAKSQNLYALISLQHLYSWLISGCTYGKLVYM